jgi:hypothetical protein
MACFAGHAGKTRKPEHKKPDACDSCVRAFVFCRTAEGAKSKQSTEKFLRPSRIFVLSWIFVLSLFSRFLCVSVSLW